MKPPVVDRQNESRASAREDDGIYGKGRRRRKRGKVGLDVIGNYEITGCSKIPK